MSDSPRSLIEKFKGACISILVAAIAIYCAVAVIKSIWPILLVIVGVVGFVGMVVGGIVVYRKIRSGW